MLRFDEDGEAVGAALPDGALLREPAFGRRKPCGIDAAGADTTMLFGVDQSRRLKNRQMFHEGGEAHPERFGQTLNRRGALEQPVDDGASCRVGERMKNAIEGCLLVRHMVNYMQWFSIWQTDLRGSKKGPPEGAALSSVVRVSPPDRQWIS